MNVGNLAARRKDGAQNNCAGNLVLARSFRVSRLGFLQHAGLRSHFFAAEDLVVVTATTTAAGTTAAFTTIATAGVAAVTWSITATRARTHAAASAVANTITGA